MYFAPIYDYGPDPSATPPAISVPAALIYYESLGQNWERAALIKARPLGDIETGQKFLKDISPFIWRKYLGLCGNRLMCTCDETTNPY